jgi:hypothetical protein
MEAQLAAVLQHLDGLVRSGLVVAEKTILHVFGCPGAAGLTRLRPPSGPETMSSHDSGEPDAKHIGRIASILFMTD